MYNSRKTMELRIVTIVFFYEHATQEDRRFPASSSQKKPHRNSSMKPLNVFEKLPERFYTNFSLPVAHYQVLQGTLR